MKDFRANLIQQDQSIKQALELLNDRPKHQTLFVIDKEEKLVGTLTDGDIRRGFLAKKTIESRIQEVMHRSFRMLRLGEYSLNILEKLRQLRIQLIPILDAEGKIVRIVDLSVKKSLLPLDAVIMAGGKGSRLLPLTKDIPKPLLPVGEKPILEHNIDRLALFGIDNVTLTIKYLGHQISNYFGNGANKGIKISYINESQPMGTIGSIRHVRNFDHDYILVMNSDLLTNIDYEKMFTEFIEKEGDIIIATSPYKVKIPYGIIETDKSQVVSIKEKPIYTFYSNAGIYIFKKSLIDFIPDNTFYNATDLIERLIFEGKKVLHYPILEYWLDIGQHEDYEKAQNDIKHLQF